MLFFYFILFIIIVLLNIKNGEGHSEACIGGGVY